VCKVSIGLSAKIFVQLDSGKLMAFDYETIKKIDTDNVFASLNDINLHLSLISLPMLGLNYTLLGETSAGGISDQATLAIGGDRASRVLELVRLKDKHMNFQCRKLIQSKSLTGKVTFDMFVLNHSNHQLNRRIRLTIDASAKLHWVTLVIVAAVALVILISAIMTAMNLCFYCFARKKKASLYRRGIDFSVSKYESGS
jgi:hypothetical protein